MLTLKTSVAATVLAGTALAFAGVGYVASQVTMTATAAVSCPAAQSATISPSPQQSKAFPPLGNIPPTTGGQKF